MAGLLPFKPSWLLKIHIKIAALKLFFLLISISSHKLGTRMINKKSLSLILSKSTEAKYGWQGSTCVFGNQEPFGQLLVPCQSAANQLF